MIAYGSLLFDGFCTVICRCGFSRRLGLGIRLRIGFVPLSFYFTPAAGSSTLCTSAPLRKEKKNVLKGRVPRACRAASCVERKFMSYLSKNDDMSLEFSHSVLRPGVPGIPAHAFPTDQGESCEYYGTSPLSGMINFDNLLWSLLTLFTVTTLEGWHEVRAVCTSLYGRWHVCRRGGGG